MSPLQMAEQAAKALAEPGISGVILTIPKCKMPKGFPRGELLNERERGGIVERTYSLNPTKVLAWLVVNGLIEVARTGDRALTFSALPRCTWTPDNDPSAPGTFHSSCGVAWTFTEGGPADNDVRFCMGCGQAVKEGVSSDATTYPF